MNEKLVKFLNLHRDRILTLWVAGIKQKIKKYKNVPSQEIHTSAGTHLDAVLTILEKGEYKPLIDYMNGIAPKRISQKFNLSDIEHAFLIGRDVIVKMLEQEWNGDLEKVFALQKLIQKPFERTIFEYSDIYQRIQIQEVEKRSNALLKAEGERDGLEALRAEREKLDHLVAAIGADIAIINRDLRVVWHNRYLGGKQKHTIKLGEKCNALNWHQEGGCKDCVTARAFESGQVEQMLIEKKESEGDTRYFQIIATPLHAPNGHIEQVLELGREVTDIKELERKIGTQQEFLDAIRNDSADAIIGLDADHTINYWNKGAVEIFGYKDFEIESKPFYTLAPAEIVISGEIDRILKQMEKDEFVRNYETELVAKNGKKVPVDLTLTAIHDNEGKVIGSSSVIRDISERKELEEQVLHNERLATVGRMASKVSHDIRNPLSSISLNAELLGDELNAFNSETAEESKALLSSIISEVERLTQISDEYLQFSRAPKLKISLSDLNKIINDLLKFSSKELLIKKIRVVKRLDRTLPMIRIDKAQIHRALLNLFRNAMEAMPNGGTLKINTASLGKYAELRISDSGMGINGQGLLRIFEPFHSTKEFGTGLGLTITRQIIEEHKGTIACDSKENIGTEFIIRLPIKKLIKGDII